MSWPIGDFTWSQANSKRSSLCDVIWHSYSRPSPCSSVWRRARCWSAGKPQQQLSVQFYAQRVEPQAKLVVWDVGGSSWPFLFRPWDIEPTAGPPYCSGQRSVLASLMAPVRSLPVSGFFTCWAENRSKLCFCTGRSACFVARELGGLERGGLGMFRQNKVVVVHCWEAWFPFYSPASLGFKTDFYFRLINVNPLTHISFFPRPTVLPYRGSSEISENALAKARV